MSNVFNPQIAPIALKSVLVTASVLTSASAAAAGLGPFRFLFMQTSATLSITHFDGTTSSFNDVKGVLWVGGEFVHAIATATSIFAMK